MRADGRGAAGPAPPVSDRLGGVEDHAQAAAAGVDHAGAAQHLELLGGARQRLAGRGRAAAATTSPAGRRRRRPRRRLGGGPGDGQHGALDRLADRGVAASAASRQRRRPDRWRCAPRARRLRDPAASAPSSWLRITPELPRAPSSAPRRERPQRRAEVGVASARGLAEASRAASTVRYMLVPVSPSGTG